MGKRGFVSGLARSLKGWRLSGQGNVLSAIRTGLGVTLIGVGTATAGDGSSGQAAIFKDEDRVVFVGNTFAERFNRFGYFETMLTARLAEKQLTFRNLAWSADAVDTRPRPLNFGSMPEHLEHFGADVIIACFGMAESFRGESGLAGFRKRLGEYVRDRTNRSFHGEHRTRLILVSPIAHEKLGGDLPDGSAHNTSLRRYTRVMRDIAEENDVPFIDLFKPTLEWYEKESSKSLTFNGIHLTEHGQWVVAEMMIDALGLETSEEEATGPAKTALAELRSAIQRKNEMFFHRWRPVNTEYIYGRRRKPFGVKHFPEELERLEALTVDMDTRINQLVRDLPNHAARPPAPRCVGRLIGAPK